ncbi:MAG: ankyrin repeat domain-containing protein, partial [Limisphaerales bacterium]
TREEAEEIERIRAIIANSPDLVNARNATPQLGTPLHKAAASGYLAVAEFLLANGAEVNAADRSRRTPLHLAASAGHKRLCELLLSQGADVKASDSKGFTPLHLAVVDGYLAVAETLLAAGAEVNTPANPGGAPEPQPDWASPPLHSAADRGFPNLVELLLKQGAEIDSVDHGGRTPLVRAMAKRRTAVVRMLLEKGAKSNALDAEGLTALHHAVVWKQASLIGLLLEHRANLDARVSAPDPEGHWTVLFQAVQDGEVALTRQLLDAGADLNARAGSGITPVHLAVLKNVPATLNVLLERKADVNVRDHCDNTPLHYAMETAAPALVEALLAAGADPNAGGWTAGAVQPWPPLFKAMVVDESMRTALVGALLKYGAEVNARTTNGWTALHRAVQYSLDPMVELLVANKADVNARGSQPANEPSLAWRKAESVQTTSAGVPGAPGMIRPPPTRLPHPGFQAPMVFSGGVQSGSKPLAADREVTPLHVAVANQNLDIARFLLEHGAEVNARDAEARTPLHFAIKYRDLELIRLLLDAKADPDARDSVGWTPLKWAADLPSTGFQGTRGRGRRGTVMWAEPKDIIALLRERGAKEPPEPTRVKSIFETDPEKAKAGGQVAFFGAVRGNGLQGNLLALPPGKVTSLSEALLQVGFADDASMSRVKLVRLNPETQQSEVRTVNLLGLKQGGLVVEEILLQGGDRVEVPKPNF